MPKTPRCVFRQGPVAPLCAQLGLLLYPRGVFMPFARKPIALLVAHICCGCAFAQTGGAVAAAQADQLPTVTVSAQPQPQTTVIGQEQLEKEPPRNIRGVFDNTPGVDFSTMTGVLGDIEIRGMGGIGDGLGVGSDRVTVELDGMDITQSFSFGHSMHYGRQLFDPADLKQVNVHKGPGANGLAGSVQFRTKDPADYLRPGQRLGGDVRAGYSGDTRDIAAGFSLAALIDERQSASLSYTRRSYQELDNKGGLDIDGPQRTKSLPVDGRSHSLNGKWVLQPNRDHKLTLNAQYYGAHSDIDRRNALGTSTSSRGSTTTHSATEERKNTRSALSLSHDLNAANALFDGMSWQLSMQRTRGQNLGITDRTGTTGARTLTTDKNYFKTSSYTFKADFDKAIAPAGASLRQDWSYGFKLQRSEAELDLVRTVGSRISNPTYFPRNQQWQASVHVANRLGLGESGVSLTPSAKVSHIRIDPSFDAGVTPVEGTRKYSKTAVGGGLLLDWKLNDNHLLSASFNRSTRLPGYGESNGQSYGHWPSRPNPNLKPETATGVELAWSSFGALGRQKATVFHNAYSNMIEVDCGDYGHDAVCTVFNEPGRTKVHGFEWEGSLNLGALGAAHGLHLDGALAYSKGKQDDGKPLLRVNPLHGHVGLRYAEPGDRWGGQLRVKWSAAKKKADLPSSRYASLPGYGVVDLTAYYKPTANLTLSGGIYNIGDKRYALWNRARGITKPDFSSYTEAGRYVGVNLRYQF
ncbi:ligand-gated channel [Vandammella animalimorsus]|uniref:Ligand-gated channel n=2 Tax=Vandammella animalimorsus TaxID=2029117 RepID=A0A2A2ADL2_9BURK|nr:ligand-gated channel [Vandammella animalimorsus]